MPAWISVDERLPRHDLDVMLWGDDLVVGEDFPLMGRLCACHGEWVLDGFEDESLWESEEEWTRRMLGTVTHWLEWEPGPELSEGK